MTNGDKVRTLGDAQLADVLANDGCPYSVFGGPEYSACRYPADDCDQCWMRWLREEYKGENFNCYDKVPEIEEVIHCRDCAFWGIDQDGNRFCSGPMAYTDTPEDWFCAGAKERETPSLNKWEVVKGVLTPGGDPYLICPVCHSDDSGHMGGVENPRHWNYCPVCGAELEE